MDKEYPALLRDLMMYTNKREGKCPVLRIEAIIARVNRDTVNVNTIMITSKAIGQFISWAINGLDGQSITSFRVAHRS